MSSPILRCIDVSKSYQDGNHSTQVLDKVNLQVNKGETLAILGSSGCGKSTLLHILGTLDKPDSGQIIYEDTDLSKLSALKQAEFRNRNLGFVYQFHHLLPEFTALENIAMPKMIAGASKKEALQSAMELLQRVGLEQRKQHKPSQMSGGERQRIAIARAMINQPSIIMADEPTGNLDSDTSLSVLELIKELNENYQTSFVIVTHDQYLASQMKRTLRLQKGKFLD